VSSTGFRELSASGLGRALTKLLLPRIAEALNIRDAGHCMRVFDLDHELTVTLATELRREVPGAGVYVLENGQPAVASSDLYVSSTKLVELRNPNADGTLRPPLCVFLPPNVKTSAEDSFGAATFEDFDLGDIYGDLRDQLLQELPGDVQSSVRGMLQHLSSEGWRWARPVSAVRYLLAARENGVDAESLGASICEIGLVPDFRLFEDLSTVYGRVKKNLDCVRSITNSDRTLRARVLDLDLSSVALRRRLASFLAQNAAEDPTVWALKIASEKENWDLSFDKWDFSTGIAADKIAINNVETDLPTVESDEKDEKLLDLVGQRLLAPKERKKLTVTFEVDPHPSQVSALSYFTVQIMSQAAGPTGVTKKVKAWRPKRKTCTVALSKLDKVEFDEGWHYIRVLPWAEDGDPVSLDGDSTTSSPRNESDLFYILPSAVIEEEPPQRAVPRATSVEHARLERQFTAILQGQDPWKVKLEKVEWTQASSKRRTAAQEIIEAKFGRDGAFQVPVPRCLKLIEQRMLAAPEQAASWRVQIHMGEANEPTADTCELPNLSAVRVFTDARRTYLNAVRQAPLELVSQAASFSDLGPAALKYASAYKDLIEDLRQKVERLSGSDQQRALLHLRSVLGIDTIRLVITDHRGQVREAALLGPLHPLRAVWHSGWAALSATWVEAAGKAAEEFVTPTRLALLKGLTPLNFPALLSLNDGRVFTSVDDVHPFWSLYAPATEEDPRGLLSDVCGALGVPEPSIGGMAITAETLASRLTRYLHQHPYVRTLIVNAFNPGRAALLADALLLLQQDAAFANLRYDLRLFVPDPEAPGVGEAISQLTSPDTGSAMDVFSIPGKNHLFSKLSFAVRSTRDFRVSPQDFRAHVSLLFDVFPPQEVGISKAPVDPDCASLHGLVQEFTTTYSDDEHGNSWSRIPRYGSCPSSFGSDDIEDILCSLPELMARATSTVAQSAPAFDSLPVITLQLDADQRSLIFNVHEVSDWVFTVDRNMGIEFFDHGGTKDRPDYLIDYVPSAAPGQGHRLIVSSRSVAELEAMLRPVLKQYGLDAAGRHAAKILAELRALSGRLALKLVTSSTARAEVLGLALARLYLDYQGALSNQIVVPLDSHVDLFRSPKSRGVDLGDDLNSRRTDLALFDLDHGKRTITCSLVEVKCYAQQLGFSGYANLKNTITEQVNQSERALQNHFDPDRTTPDRPDRLLKTRELGIILRFYLERSVRYGLMDSEANQEARSFLRSLEEGYRLQFRRSGLVFDFEKNGTNPVEHEVGIEFHRIGADLIRKLIEGAAPTATTTTTDGGDGEPPVSSPPVARPPVPGLPLLDSAAFLVAGRERATSFDLSDSSGNRESSLLDEEKEWGPANESMGPEEADDSRDQNSIVEAPEQVSDPGSGAEARSEEDPAATDIQSSEDHPRPLYDVLLGVSGDSPQYGILGEFSGRKIALDLNQTHTMSLFGVQGGGKSYTLGTVIELACLPLPQLSALPRPLGAILFHYSSTLDYKPEFTTMTRPNSDEAQVRSLRERYGAEPERLEDVVILSPAAKVEERQAEYPDIEVVPLAFSSQELKASHWKFLMGAVGSQSLYLRQVNLLMKKLRGNLTLDAITRGIDESALSDHLKDLAKIRLNFAAEYIDDTFSLTSVLKPGRLVIVDLRDELTEKDEALGLFVVLLQIFAEATHEGEAFNKLVVFDEAHKYVENQDLVTGLVEVVREMRHKGTSILVASQDPPSVPTSLIELSSQIILHKFNSPAWLKHIQKANSALSGLTPEKLSSLGAGEAYVWSSKATDAEFTRGAVRIRCRPRVTQHGGATKTAL
jgi:DNA phosphorothioation-dependent restriction protein DptH